MHLWGEAVSLSTGFFLLLALGLALSFEFVNGFHDTANAVATVIYTHTLKPTYAVIWSGLWNLIGVLTSAGLVAYGIIALLPSDLVLNVGSYAGFAMVFALLISAIVWNLGTWYLGLPASSSHTLIGAIIGVGVAYAVMNGHPWSDGVNWGKVQEIGWALLLSPLVGFIGSALLLLVTKVIIPSKELFEAPTGDTPPPMWIRGLLMLTCTGVSFGHGNNDGQKGMGLIMLILIGLLPGAFALQSPDNPAVLQKVVDEAKQAIVIFDAKVPAPAVAPAPAPAPVTPAVSTTTAKPAVNIAPLAATDATVAPMAPVNKLEKTEADKEVKAFTKSGKITDKTYAAFSEEAHALIDQIGGINKFEELPAEQRRSLRKDLYILSDGIGKLTKANIITGDDAKTLTGLKGHLESFTKYIPVWVKVLVAFALGFGTMIGWKRIVVTVGEKIGKAHLTYAQGGSAELVAAATVLGASWYGWPVSTTHVLSSGIAGTMAANRSGLQTQTLINILLAWVLTLPVCVFLGATTFSAGLYIVFHFLGAHS